MKKIILLLVLFSISSFSFSQTSDGGFEYRDFNIALNVDARIRCNYTYSKDLGGNIKWNTVALGVIYNNRDVDVRVDYNFYHNSIKGYQCYSAANKFFTIKANSKRVICTTDGFNPYSSSSTTFRDFDYKIKPEDMILIVSVHGSFAYSDFLAAGNKIFSKSKITYEECEKAVNYYKAAFKQNPYDDELVDKINEANSYCSKVKLNEETLATKERENQLFNRYTNNAKIFQSSNNYEAALEEFKKALEIRPNSNFVITSIDNLEEKIKRQQQINKRNSANNNNNIKQPVSIGLENQIDLEKYNKRKILLNQGRDAFNSKDYESALKYFKKAQEIEFNEFLAKDIKTLENQLGKDNSSNSNDAITNNRTTDTNNIDNSSSNSTMTDTEAQAVAQAGALAVEGLAAGIGALFASEGEFSIHPNAGFTFGDGSIYSFTAALEFNYLWYLSDKFNLGLSFGYVHYFGNNETFFDEEFVYDDSSFIPVGLGLRYDFTDKINLGLIIAYRVFLESEDNSEVFIEPSQVSISPRIYYGISEKIYLSGILNPTFPESVSLGVEFRL